MHMYERVCIVRQAEVKRSPTSSSGGTRIEWRRRLKCGSGRDGLKKQTPQYPRRGAKKKDGGDGAGYLYDLKLPNEKTLRDKKRGEGERLTLRS